MKRLYIVVEGQTEEEFVKGIIAPYLRRYGIVDVTPTLIRTSKRGRGGFVNYEHLKNDVKRLLYSSKTDFIVSMFVDFFRCPELPHKEQYENESDHVARVEKMEKCIEQDINDHRFIPYIQLHEFEALLFSSNDGFGEYFSDKEENETKQIVAQFQNPEDINSSPDKAPSKRLLAIKDDYDKVNDGNLIALVVGIDKMLEKCPRFRAWIDKLAATCK